MDIIYTWSRSTHWESKCVFPHRTPDPVPNALGYMRYPHSPFLYHTRKDYANELTLLLCSATIELKHRINVVVYCH